MRSCALRTGNTNRFLSSSTTNDGLTSALTWDILYGDGVVSGETKNGEATNCTYGLERVSALNGSTPDGVCPVI